MVFIKTSRDPGDKHSIVSRRNSVHVRAAYLNEIQRVGYPGRLGADLKASANPVLQGREDVRLSSSDVAAIAVVGLSVPDIARVVRQQSPVPGAGGRAVPVQAWTPQPLVEDPADRERGRNDAYLQRKAQERERGFQQQQRQQADDRRDLRLERRLAWMPTCGCRRTDPSGRDEEGSF
jgi:hypothetical protein